MGTLQARILEWVAMPSSGESSQPRYQIQVSHITYEFFTISATREAQEYWSGQPSPSPGDLPDPGIELGSPALTAILYCWATKRDPGRRVISHTQNELLTESYTDAGQHNSRCLITWGEIWTKEISQLLSPFEKFPLLIILNTKLLSLSLGWKIELYISDQIRTVLLLKHFIFSVTLVDAKRTLKH